MADDLIPPIDAWDDENTYSYTYPEEDIDRPLCVCGRQGDEVCNCCGTPLCFMCYEVGAGFCAGMACATEERLAEMDRLLHDEEEDDA